MLSRTDPTVRLILAAIALASLLPVRGAALPWVQGLSSAAVFVLFLLYGLKLARGDVRAGLGNLRLLLPLVLFVFGVMALAGWGLWQAAVSLLLPPALALGFLYMGVLPSTVQSATTYASLAGGNVAASVVSAAMLNILGVFISAPLFSLLAGGSGGAFHAAALIKVMTMMLLPFVLGQMAQGWAGPWLKGHKRTTTLLERGTIGLAVYVAFSGAVVQGIWGRIDGPAWGLLAGATGLLLLIGYGGAWLLGGALRLPRADRITMLFAGAQKSVAMGAPLATVLFARDVAGLILMPLLVYHLAQMVLAAPIAARLRRITYLG